MPPEEGDTHVVERSFTPADVRQFADLSGDDQPQYTEPDEDGRLLVHGLLTATVPTEVGSELGMLARTFTFEAHRPVYTSQTVRCACVVEEIEETEEQYNLTVEVTCTCEGEVVMTGSVAGIVGKP
ncbi:dehydratase [Halogeometricum borinquense]|uniref:Dehydratase n=1 Tax=Halogeometricum borinquense TaxID=60847 RepID=A0A6C0UH27_9EURY|nr:dehydratase [Halogeometricum borinquense]QIB74735.1 dehydratase [Halogeometricum borinquense]QIQ76310.1 dehydratase [Halogeometricum borinquense]